jgi:phosphoglycerate dehydrogenase-like enzyme
MSCYRYVLLPVRVYVVMLARSLLCVPMAGSWTRIAATGGRRAFSEAAGIKKVGVIGCGLMGHGIVQLSAANGFDVVAYDVDQKFLDAGMKRITTSACF